MTTTLFQSSRLAAASFGLGIGALVGIGVALVTGAMLGAEASPLAPGAGLAFWAAALMAPSAIVTGVVAKIRLKQPGWWSTLGILLGAAVLVIVLVTLVFILAIVSTKS